MVATFLLVAQQLLKIHHDQHTQLCSILIDFMLIYQSLCIRLRGVFSTSCLSFFVKVNFCSQ